MAPNVLGTAPKPPEKPRYAAGIIKVDAKWTVVKYQLAKDRAGGLYVRDQVVTDTSYHRDVGEDSARKLIRSLVTRGQGRERDGDSLRS